MSELTPDRLAAARELIRDLLEPNGCLKAVLVQRLAARGFEHNEIRVLLDQIAKDAGYTTRRFKHPVLNGVPCYSKTGSGPNSVCD